MNEKQWLKDFREGLKKRRDYTFTKFWEEDMDYRINYFTMMAQIKGRTTLSDDVRSAIVKYLGE